MHRSILRVLAIALAASQLAVVGLATAGGASGPSVAPAEPRVPAPPPITDFNGDGLHDLAIAAAMEDVGTIVDAGGVNVLYGSSPVLSKIGNQFWTQDSGGIKDQAETGDQFGTGVAAGDFDGDGFADLAVGAPFDTVGSVNGAGVVNVIYGSAAGLTNAGNRVFTQDTGGMLDQAERNDLFGASLAAGDLDGDGFDDLAIGVRQEAVAGQASAGAVNVVYGSAMGLTTAGNQFWTQDDLAGEGAEAGDVFSRGLAIGDLDGDGFADLAVGAWNEDVGAVSNAGAVNVLFGSAAGITAAGNQYLTEGADLEANAWFGKPIATGDFDADGFFDMAVGAHLHSVGAQTAAGQVDVYMGSAGGLPGAADQVWTEDDLSPPADGSEQGDHFGRIDATADFDGDGFADLAIGISEEDVGAVDAAGAAAVLYGSAGGLTAAGSQFWTQDSGGIKDQAEADDLSGWFVLGGDFNGDGFFDLADGAAFEDLAALTDAGGVNVIYGSAGVGLTAANNQFWTQNNTGILDQAEVGDLLGVIMT